MIELLARGTKLLHCGVELAAITTKRPATLVELVPLVIREFLHLGLHLVEVTLGLFNLLGKSGHL
jgi:hypothetical protein